MKRRAFLLSGIQISGLTALASAQGRSWLRLTDLPVNAGNNDLDKLFLAPPLEARPYTLWHWMNGVISREGITADLESFKEAGLGGAQMFLVGGSEAKIDDPANQIMSENWKELFSHALKESGRLGLKLGTHNSPGWSSTGYKTIVPEQAMQQVVFTETLVGGNRSYAGPIPQPIAKKGFYRDIVCWGVKKEGPVNVNEMINLSGHLSSNGDLNWQVPSGDWVVLRIGHTVIEKFNLTAPVSGQGLEVDKLDAQALRAYWKTFPDQLNKLAGKFNGSVFNRYEVDSYEMGAQNWTSKMPAEFKKRRGYDILPFLVQVSGRLVTDKETTSRFQWDWKETIKQLFAENYYGTMQQLIKEQGMEFILEPYATGHDQPFESNNAAKYGDVLMCEFWQKPTTWGWDSVKPTASGAHTWGKNIVAAEAFTGQPNSAWKVDPYALKSVGDRAFAGGVNMLFFHTSAHQPWKNVYPGMTMGQWGTHFGRTQLWWTKGGKEWISYLTRCQFMLRQGKPVADLLYLVYDRVTPKPIPGFYDETIGTDALLTRLEVINGELALSGGLRYQLLILPDSGQMRPDIILKIKSLVKAGAKIAGRKPERAPGLTDRELNDRLVKEIAEELWGKAEAPSHNIYGKGQVFSLQPVPEVISKLNLTPDLVSEGNGQMPLLWVHRQLDNGTDIYFISNQEDRTIQASISTRGEDRIPELWSADSGNSEEAPCFQFKTKRTITRIEFDPSGSVFLVFRRKRRDPLLTLNSIRQDGSPKPYLVKFTKEKGGRATLAASAGGTYSLDLSNGTEKVISIDQVPLPLPVNGAWQLTFKEDGKEKTMMSDKLSSWTEMEELKYYSGTILYETTIQIAKEQMTEKAEAYLDLGKVFNTVSVMINGKDMGLLWKPPFAIDLTGKLKAGVNKLSLQVTNLWANRLIGDEQYPDDMIWEKRNLKEIPVWLNDITKRPEPRRKTFTTFKFFNKDSALLPSGLIGPVFIHFVKTVPVSL